MYSQDFSWGMSFLTLYLNVKHVMLFLLPLVFGFVYILTNLTSSEINNYVNSLLKTVVLATKFSNG